MGTRTDFQDLLEDVTDAATVYFQPPPNLEMVYPAIVYNKDSERVQYADNARYSGKLRYQVTIIDRNPDTAIPDQVATVPYSFFSRHYTTENLYHYVYIIYF